jgi:hypothetical protein
MHIENLRRGDWILITQFKNLDIEDHGPQHEQPGVPLRVRAVSPPFVLVSKIFEQRVVTIDIRLWSITRAADSYVKTWKGLQVVDSQDPKAMPMEGRSRVFYCPICSDGVFNLVAEEGRESFFQCTICGCVVVEEANQA